MGASFWSYVVPYDADVERAFRALQTDVFERRAYFSIEEGRAFSSIEELLEEQAADGTHSILDMQRVVNTPAPPRADAAQAAQRLLSAVFGEGDGSFGTIYRLSESEAIERFGVERLTAEPEPSTLDIERGTGRYAILYKSDRPKWLWFGGLSGD